MKKQFIISTSVELVRIAPERIVYISSDGNYSTIVQTDGVVTIGAAIACRKTLTTWSGEKSKSSIRKTGIPTKTII